MKLFITALLAASAFTSVALANDNAAEFVKKASISNMFEIESSKVALQKGQTKEVKDFAQKMIDDRTKAGNELKATLADAKLEVKPAAALDEKHQDKLDKLNKEDAKDFDKKYLAAQEDAHEGAVSLFDDYAEDGDNAALKQFAAKTLPTLKSHKEHVEKLND